VFNPKTVFSFLFTLLFAATAIAQLSPPAVAAAHPDLNTIVDRMEQSALANRGHYRPYVLTREYLMYGGKVQEKPSSAVVAEITFVPPTTKEYKIVEASGSSRGEGVVRHILDSESKATATGNAPGAVSRKNYDFTYLGEGVLDGRRCYILGMQPKRKDKDLVIGRAWVDNQTFLVRRIQGQMAKLPSWWLKSVDVTLDFDEAGGMWLQTRTKAVAEVRVFGTHVLTAHAVKFQASDTVAQNAAPAKPAARGAAAKHPQRVIGAALPPR
jgi:hypothetical protein